MTFEWRAMREADLPAVLALSVRVHPGFPEGEAMFRNRLSLFPAGCLVLCGGGEIGGYAVSHPIRRYAPPPLDAILPGLPEAADDYYLHDVALAPERRGRGHAASGIGRLLDLAARFETASLVSVYGTGPFWARFGFRPAEKDMRAKLAPYGEGAIYMLRRN
ncbi:GNAT family N-acetyltransferase [Aureimonas populi]|uniref:GNAT family N-acetyltransferase n=1 Tax=Aureimonas populi TaxID=1701758 RepID=A0ABW5CL56_9HYPH|nr:GNAT family N-acetyltransferase [Aureimonas populi]